jgi:CRP/FNR family transcriptional regulator
MDKNSAIKFFLNTFAGGDDETLRKALYSVSIVKKIKKKEILFFEGEHGSYIYFVVSGQIKLFKTNDEGKEAIIHFVKTGETFAEILFQLKETYPVSSMALEDSVILGIDSKKLYDTIKKQPEIAMKLIALLAG